MKKEYGYPTLKVICQASAGNETAIREILKFYDAYICKLCLRPFYHSESGWRIKRSNSYRNDESNLEIWNQSEIIILHEWKTGDTQIFVLSPMLFFGSYQGSFNRGKFVVKLVFYYTLKRLKV